jgi:hypothetical protein
MTMPREGHHASGSCVVSVLDKATCSSQTENMAIHHIGAYNSFTNIILSIFTLLAMTLVVVGVFTFELLKPQLSFVSVSESFSPQTTHLRRWLSRFINSPTFN